MGEPSEAAKKWFWMVQFCKDVGVSPADSYWWDKAEREYYEHLKKQLPHLHQSTKYCCVCQSHRWHTSQGNCVVCFRIFGDEQSALALSAGKEGDAR